MNSDIADRFFCWDNKMMMMDGDDYLTAGTDEVSMGMVKRVLYTATGGSCRDPEAVSYCRNKSGDKETCEASTRN